MLREIDTIDGSILTWSTLENPYPRYHWMRRHDPVHWSEVLQAWVLTSYEDVAAAFRDLRFSSDRLSLVLQNQLQGLDPAAVSDYVSVFGRSVLMQDPPQHTRLRKVTNHGFTHQAVAGWVSAIEKVVNELLEGLPRAGRMDLIRDFAEPLPSIIIAELFGVPAEGRHQFYEWSNDLARFFGGAFVCDDIQEVARDANEGARQLKLYFKGMIEQRREDLGDDLLSQLIRGQIEGALDEEELCAQCVFILAAGHITLIDQISNGIHAFLKHPAELQRLIENPSLISSAVDEVLRYDGAVPFMNRLAKEDLWVRGRLIKKNQVVFLGIGPANHDPDRFEEPDRFDITRPDNKHLSFAIGPHHCLGARLAQLEIAIALNTIFRRLPHLRLDPEHPPVLKSSLLFRGFHSLPAVY